MIENLYWAAVVLVLPTNPVFNRTKRFSVCVACVVALLTCALTPATLVTEISPTRPCRFAYFAKPCFCPCMPDVCVCVPLFDPQSDLLNCPFMNQNLTTTNIIWSLFFTIFFLFFSFFFCYNLHAFRYVGNFSLSMYVCVCTTGFDLSSFFGPPRNRGKQQRRTHGNQ